MSKFLAGGEELQKNPAHTSRSLSHLSHLNLKTTSLSFSDVKVHLYGSFFYIEVIGLIHPPSENFGSEYYHPKSDRNCTSHTSIVFEAKVRLLCTSVTHVTLEAPKCL